MTAMQLEASNGAVVMAPTAAQIASALSGLPGGTDSFAILSSGEQAYVQVAGSAAEGFALEYRAGSESEHYQAATSMPLNVVQDVFERYARNDPTWRSRVSWVPLEAGSVRGGHPVVVLSIVAIACVAAVVWFAATR